MGKATYRNEPQMTLETEKGGEDPMPYLERSFSAKEPYNQWLFCGK